MNREHREREALIAPEIIEQINGLSKWLYESARIESSAFDSAPEPVSQFDYDLVNASEALGTIANALSALSTKAQPPADTVTLGREEYEALKKDAERYGLVKSKAVKKTAYDRYGNGAHWNIGIYSDDSSCDFDHTVDAARTGKDKS